MNTEICRDVITLSSLSLSAKIGIRDYEKLMAQRLTLEVSFSVDTKKAAQSDDINDATDYSAVYAQIRQFIDTQRFHLLETMADQLAQHLKQVFRMGWVKLAITKFPKDMPDVAGVTLTIER